MEGFRFLVEGPAPRLTPSLRLRNVIVPRERVKDTSQTCYFFKTIEKAEREKIYELVAEGLMCLRLWQSEPERQTCRLIDPATVYSLPYTCTQAHREAMPYFKTIHELTICLRHNIKPRLTILPTPTLSTIRRLVVYRLPGFPLDLKALRNLDTVILGFQDIPTPVVMLPTLGFPTAQPYTDDDIAARAWTAVWNYARGKGNSPIFHPNSTPSGYIIKAVQLAVSPLKARYYLYDMDEYWGSNYHTIDVWGKTDEELVKNAMKLMRKHWAKYLGLMGRYY